jgi:hypothetical protein
MLKYFTLKNRFLLILIVLNIISASIAFYLSINQYFPDAEHYLAMAESINYGKYSSWYFLDKYYPETLRTPAYPLFLFILKNIFNSTFIIQVIQLILYFFSLFFVSKILLKITLNIRVIYVFLSLTIFNIQIPYYSGFISAEMLSIFLTSCYLYFFICKPITIKNSLMLGVIAAVNTMTRPSFLLFPFIISLVLLIIDRSKTKYLITHAIMFLILLIPFGIWNYKNHGGFKLTSLEGGAGVAHMGYWSFKLPKGYQDKNYWIGNVLSVHDLTNPFHFSDEERNANKILYESEWKYILNELDKTLTTEDIKYHKVMLDQMNTRGYSPLHKSEYTKKREQLLWQKTLENIKKDPWYYIKTRLYTFCRLYFTGINTQDFKYKNTAPLMGKLNLYYPFLISFVFIFTGLLLSLVFIIKKRLFKNVAVLTLVMISIYQGVIHTPFSVQARYTVPVHLIILGLLSISIYYVFFNKVLKND